MSLVNLAGAAKLLKVTRQRVSQLYEAGRFPPASTALNGRPLWQQEVIVEFGRTRLLAKDESVKGAKKTKKATKKVAKKKTR